MFTSIFSRYCLVLLFSDSDSREKTLSFERKFISLVDRADT